MWTPAAAARVVGALVMAASVPAFAHGSDGSLVRVRLAGNTAYVMATPPQRVFSSFDSDRDGKLAADEVRAGRDGLLTAFEAAFRVLDAAPGALRPRIVFRDVLVPAGPAAAGARHLVVRLRLRWGDASEVQPGGPRRLRIQWDHAADAPLVVTAQRVAPRRLVPEQVPLGRALRQRLTAYHPGHDFDLGPAPVTLPSGAGLGGSSGWSPPATDEAPAPALAPSPAATAPRRRRPLAGWAVAAVALVLAGVVAAGIALLRRPRD